MQDVWDIVVRSVYVPIGENPVHYEMYPALAWPSDWSWMYDDPDGIHSFFYGRVNPQMKSEISTSPNVVLISAEIEPIPD